MVNGTFRKKKVYFSQVSNTALRDKSLSLKAKGLYSLIQSYITIENFILYKDMLAKESTDGKTAFQSAWNELKEKGYLVQYRTNTGKGWAYEYELLDTPISSLPIHGKSIHGEQGIYNKTNINNTDLNNTENNNSIKSSFSNDASFEYIENREQIFQYFISKYSQHYGINHPFYKKQLKDKCFDNLFEDGLIDAEFVETMIDDFFTNFKDVNSYGDKREKTFALFCEPEIIRIFVDRNK